MTWLGRVPPSAGRDVVDRKACFLSLLAQAAVLASIRGPACHLETFGQSNGEVRRPSPNESRTARSGDPRRTSPERRGQETLAEGVPNGGVRRPSPNESPGKGGRGDRKAPERSQFTRVLVVDRAKLTTNQGRIGQAERTQFPAGGNETQGHGSSTGHSNS